ncbi:MAG TPA: hypothetical protein ENH53_11480, partial [Bacteroidetes bacterium]|nr:hypothetical protein [Bacteroidota bacterium]
MLTIPLNQIIDQDDFYRITFLPDLRPLVESMKRIGQSQPILVQPVSGVFYRIVSGFKRFWAAKELNWSDIRAETAEVDSEQPFSLFQKSLFENLAIRQLNWVEKAFVLQKLVQQFQIPREKIISEWLPILNIGKNQKWLVWLSKIPDYELIVKEAIAKDEITFDLFEFFPALSADDRVALVQFYRELKLGKNRQKEFFYLLRDVMQRDNTSMTHLLENQDVQQIVKAEDLALGNKVQKIRGILRRWRYSSMNEMEKRFREIVHSLRLPPGIQL